MTPVESEQLSRSESWSLVAQPKNRAQIHGEGLNSAAKPLQVQPGHGSLEEDQDEEVRSAPAQQQIWTFSMWSQWK